MSTEPLAWVATTTTTLRWQDDDWMARRAAANSLSAPLNVYEVHLGSWRRAPDGRLRVQVPVRGNALLSHPVYNKGTAFTAAERRAFGLEGLLPREANTIEQQLARIHENITIKTEPLERYVGMASLHDRNETLFFRQIGRAHV